MTLRGLSCGSCEWVTGWPVTWCAMAQEHCDWLVCWLWIAVFGPAHCEAEHRHFYGGEPYRATRLFR